MTDSMLMSRPIIYNKAFFTHPVQMSLREETKDTQTILRIRSSLYLLLLDQCDPLGAYFLYFSILLSGLEVFHFTKNRDTACLAWSTGLVSWVQQSYSPHQAGEDMPTPQRLWFVGLIYQSLE